jgi:hypothetical protein
MKGSPELTDVRPHGGSHVLRRHFKRSGDHPGGQAHEFHRQDGSPPSRYYLGLVSLPIALRWLLHGNPPSGADNLAGHSDIAVAWIVRQAPRPLSNGPRSGYTHQA